jgi:hypothetical protein
MGNVQEFTAEGTVRGGSYDDPIEKCTPSLIKPAPAGGDKFTGLRVARDLN